MVYPLLWSRPDRKACRHQTMSTVAALTRRGHRVTLLMPRWGDDPALTSSDLRAYFDIDGDFELIQRRSRWAGDALARTLLWLRQVFRDPVLADADLIYSRIPAMIGAGSLSPIPFVTDHYRPWPDELPAIRPLVRWTSRRPGCLGVICHSAYAEASYRRIGVDPAKLLVAHNGYDPPYGAWLDTASARTALALPADRPVAVYAGRVNERKGLDQIFELARLRPGVSFALVGSEGHGPIEAQARNHPNVMIVPWQNPAELRVWLAAADVLLVPPSRAPLERFRDCVLPIKLFAYLAAGKPILAPASPDTAELLREGDNAVLVPPERPAEAAAALDRMLEDSGLARQLGASAKSSARVLTWDRRAERIERFLYRRFDCIDRVEEPVSDPRGSAFDDGLQPAE